MAKTKTEAIVITAVRNLRKSIKIEYIQGTDEYALNCHDNPLPSFYKALTALNAHVCSLCEFPAKDAEKIEATGITVREKGDNALALVVARKRIRKGKRIFNVATPLLPMWPDEENKGVDYMDNDIAKAIEKVVSEAKKYVIGDRAQGQIEFEDDKKEEGEKAPDNTEQFPELKEDANA